MAYTGWFPHTNSGNTTAIIISGATFTGNVTNTGTKVSADNVSAAQPRPSSRSRGAS